MFRNSVAAHKDTYPTLEEKRTYRDAYERYREEIPTEADAFAAQEDLYGPGPLVGPSWQTRLRRAVEGWEISGWEGVRWVETEAGLHLFRVSRPEPSADLSGLTENHHLPRLTADPDVDVETMLRFASHMLPVEVHQWIIFDPRFQVPAPSSAYEWDTLAVALAATGRVGPLALPKSAPMPWSEVMARVPMGRYEEDEWIGPAFHGFVGESFRWLTFSTMPLDGTGRVIAGPKRKQLKARNPYHLLPGDRPGEFYLPGGYLIQETPERGVVAWPRALGPMPAAPVSDVLAYPLVVSSPGKAGGVFTSPPRLEVFAEEGRLPHITAQKIRKILATMGPEVEPSLRGFSVPVASAQSTALGVVDAAMVMVELEAHRLAHAALHDGVVGVAESAGLSRRTSYPPSSCPRPTSPTTGPPVSTPSRRRPRMARRN